VPVGSEVRRLLRRASSLTRASTTSAGRTAWTVVPCPSSRPKESVARHSQVSRPPRTSTQRAVTRSSSPTQLGARCSTETDVPMPASPGSRCGTSSLRPASSKCLAIV
jgi:hypothetical protein